MFRGTQIGVKSSGQPAYPQVLSAGARPGSGGVAVRCGRGQGGRGGGGSKGAGGGCREPCAGGAWVAGGSDAQLLGSRAGRRRLRPRLSFRGSALHQVRLTERSPCPSRMFSPAERVCVRVAGARTAGIPFCSPHWGRSYSGLPSSSAPGDTAALRGSLSPGAARRVPRAPSRHRRACKGAAGGGARVLLRARRRIPLAERLRGARQQPMGTVAPLDAHTGRGAGAGPRSGKRGGLEGAVPVSRSRQARDQPLQVGASVTPWAQGAAVSPSVDANPQALGAQPRTGSAEATEVTGASLLQALCRWRTV